ncbi:hypothetical protein Dimus_021327, partial [Dionaea muscipula]
MPTGHARAQFFVNSEVARSTAWLGRPCPRGTPCWVLCELGGSAEHGLARDVVPMGHARAPARHAGCMHLR